MRLYAPWVGTAEKMRARGREGGVEMGNTSGVDLGVLEGWDESPLSDDEEDGGEEYSGGDGESEGGGTETGEGYEGGHEKWDGERDGNEGHEVREEMGEANKPRRTRKEQPWEAEFKQLDYLDCILEPGEMLYIPVGWWHYVRSLSVSFSVSFWWN